MNLDILKIASDTNNNKSIKNYTHHSKLKNSMCGDEMQIDLVIKKNKIVDFGYQGKSCVYCQASVSLLSQKIKNKDVNDVKKFIKNCEDFFENSKINLEKKWSSFKELFDKKNISRKECLLLPIRTVDKALND